MDAGSRGGFREMSLLHPFVHMYSLDADETVAPDHPDFASFRHFPLALYSSDGEMDLHVTAQPGMTSLLEFDAEAFNRHFGLIPGSAEWRQGLKTVHRQRTRLQTADRFLREQSIERVDFLKLDTQGTELEILRGASEYLGTGKISIIKTEISLLPVYREQCVFGELDNFLRACGFILVDCIFYPDAIHPWRPDKAISVSLEEQPRFSAVGDAVYVLDPASYEAADRGASTVRSALILNQLGYVSLAFDFLMRLGLETPIAETLLRDTAVRADRRTRLKKFLKNQLPPWAFRRIQRFRKSLVLRNTAASRRRGA